MDNFLLASRSCPPVSLERLGEYVFAVEVDAWIVVWSIDTNKKVKVVDSLARYDKYSYTLSQTRTKKKHVKHFIPVLLAVPATGRARIRYAFYSVVTTEEK